MPPPNQRRNTAYLNRLNHGSAGAGCGKDAQRPLPEPDLRLISGARSSSASDRMPLALPTWMCRAL